MKNKILESSYDKDTGVSTVTIESKWGTFTRSVVAQDEDKDIANRWDGCRFAHYLCTADMLKAKGKAFVERANGMNHAANVLAGIRYDTNWLYPDVGYGDAILDLRIQAEVAEDYGRECISRAKEMKQNYLSYVEDILTKRRKLRESYKAFSE